MSRSWGHEIERLSEGEIADLRAQDRNAGRGEPLDRWSASACRVGRADHRAPVEYRIRIRYVTGRAGRVTFAEKLVCTAHAKQFAAKHNLDFAAVTPGARRPHAVERAINSFQRDPK